MDTEKLDVVYILGNGSNWNNNEIRYSLRSIGRNLKFRSVYIIGCLPSWVKKVNYIPSEDPFKDKLKNTCYKLRIACNDKNISEDFILMNDDFFIMKKISYIKPYFRGILHSVKNNHPTKAGYYHKAQRDTIEFLESLGIYKPKDYSLHYPFIFNKKKLLKVLDIIESQDNQLLLRTVYGNIHEIGGEFKRDVKMKNLEDLEDPRFLSSDVLSTNNRIVKQRSFFMFIHKKFNRPSPFENIMSYN